MNRFELKQVASNGATYIQHNLEPNFKMLVVNNGDFDYDKFADVYDLFEFRGNTFALVIDEATASFDYDEIEDFNYIRSIIKKAFKWYRSQVHIQKYVPEMKEGKFEDSRYLLKPSSKPDWWVCADKNFKIVVKWKEHLFNDTQEATELEDLDLSVTQIAKVLQEMGKWLRENHYNKIF